MSRPSTTTGSCPATSERTITCTPATYDDGSASSQRPEAPSRRAEASTLASTARRGSTTPLGRPVEPEVSISSGAGVSASSHRDSCLIATEGSSEGRRKLTTNANGSRAMTRDGARDVPTGLR